MFFSKVEHPDYASTGSLPIANDVALLRLHQGLDLSDSPNINSICWPTVAPAVGLQVTASGWGFEWQHLGLFGNAKVLKKVIEHSLLTNLANWRAELNEHHFLLFLGFYLSYLHCSR